MIDTKDIGLPVKSKNITPPSMPRGIMDNTIIIPLNVLNCSSKENVK